MIKIIKVSTVIGGAICVATEDGQKLFDVISQSIEDDVQLEISFEGIELIISAFLNTAIGQLYGKFPKDKIDKMLSYTHLEDDDRNLLRLVVANALRYFSNQDFYDNATWEVLDYA